jgi:hypothetical protein
MPMQAFVMRSRGRAAFTLSNFFLGFIFLVHAALLDAMTRASQSMSRRAAVWLFQLLAQGNQQIIRKIQANQCMNMSRGTAIQVRPLGIYHSLLPAKMQFFHLTHCANK